MKKIIITHVTIGLFLVSAVTAHAQTIDMRDYFPTVTGNNALIKHVSSLNTNGAISANVLITQYSASADTLLQKDFELRQDLSGYDWKDTWYMKRMPTKLIEYRDDYPTITGVKALTYETGKEINWGGAYTVGQEVTSNVVADPAQSIGLNAWDPWRYAFHSFKLESILSSFPVGGATYPNVAVVDHYQIICVDSQCNYINGPSSAKIYVLRFWLAPEIGIVQTKYIYNNETPSTNGRIDYVSKKCTGPNTQYWCTN
ncbi:MAG: hypothetical protein WAX38_01390 [Minisyncoccia bacterium]